jgi:hypothetical protein
LDQGRARRRILDRAAGMYAIREIQARAFYTIG